jgi:hypothetical protein
MCTVLLCCVYCLCVNVYCTATTGCQPNFSYIYKDTRIHTYIFISNILFITWFSAITPTKQNTLTVAPHTILQFCCIPNFQYYCLTHTINKTRIEPTSQYSENYLSNWRERERYKNKPHFKQMRRLSPFAQTIKYCTHVQYSHTQIILPKFPFNWYFL